jgi:hypothetical protein
VKLEVIGHEVQVTSYDVIFDPLLKLSQQPLRFLLGQRIATLRPST